MFAPMDEAQRVTLNQRFGIEVGYRLYQLRDDEGRLHFVGAEDVALTTETVFYYVKSDLLPGERIAPWV